MRAIALILVLLVSRSADAGDQDEARRYFQAGNQAYHAGQYLAAAAAYEEAWRRDPLPATTFTLAQALRRQYYVDQDPRHLERALELYRRYLTEVPAGGRRAHAVTHIAEIVAILPARAAEPPPAAAPPPTQLMVVSRAPGASASIDGGAPARLPVTREVSPGRHRVRATAPGFRDAELEWLAVEGRLVLAEMPLQALPAHLRVRAGGNALVRIDGQVAAGPVIAVDAGAHQIAVTRRGHRPFQRRVLVDRGQSLMIEVDLEVTRQRVAARWLLGGAAAGLAAGLTTAVVSARAQSRARAILDLRAPGRSLAPVEVNEYNQQLDRRNRFRTASVLLLAGSAALAITGAVLWRFDEPTVQPMLGPTVAGASYERTF